MLFREFGRVYDLAGPDERTPQRPRRYLGELKIRHVLAAPAIALLDVTGS